MAKQRFEGRVRGGAYVLIGPDGGSLKEIPLSEARADKKLAAAIARNNWEGIPDV